MNFRSPGLFFEWATEWNWTEVTRDQLLLGLGDAEQALTRAAAAISRDEASARRLFDARLAEVRAYVKLAHAAVEGGARPASSPIASDRESNSSAAAKPPASPEAWSQEAVDLYRDLVRARLALEHCPSCGGALGSAVVLRTRTTVGVLLNEYRMGDRAAARLLADTDELVVECPHCQAHDEVLPRMG